MRAELAACSREEEKCHGRTETRPLGDRPRENKRLVDGWVPGIVEEDWLCTRYRPACMPMAQALAIGALQLGNTVPGLPQAAAICIL